MFAAHALLWLLASLGSSANLPPSDRDLSIHPAEVAHDPAIFSPFQKDALATVNRYRALLDLPIMRLDPALCTAAQAHSRYLAVNKQFGHDEKPGRPGFSGVMPWDRVRTAGYPNGCTEDISSNTDAAGAIHQLMAAPYHRIPFLEPTPVALGVGRGDNSTTLEFDGKPGAAGVVVYPADGQGGVPPSWRALEVPNPLRMHNAKMPVGYVISYHAFLAEGTRVKFRGSKLVGEDGQIVPCYRNTPENDDHLENAILMIPMRPLDPSTKYTATVDAVAGEGLDISRTWSFMTARSTGAGISMKVRGRPGGLGAVLTLQISNRGKNSSGPLHVVIGAPGKQESRAKLPAIAAGDVIEVAISVKSAYGQVRLLSNSRSSKASQVAVPASYDVRTAARRN